MREVRAVVAHRGGPVQGLPGSGEGRIVRFLSDKISAQPAPSDPLNFILSNPQGQIQDPDLPGRGTGGEEFPRYVATDRQCSNRYAQQSLLAIANVDQISNVLSIVVFRAVYSER